MALGFFRKWQKSIIVIMVALMLIFLVGGTGMKVLCSQSGRDYPRGKTKFGEISQGDAQRAEGDMQDLSRFLQLDQRSFEFIQLRQNQADAPVAYALLLQEAVEAGREVGSDEIDAYLKDIGLEVGQTAYRKLLARVDRRKSGTTEPLLREALGRWLMVLRSYQAYKVTSPPSEIQLRKRFRDLNEKLMFRVVKVSADEYAKSVPEPTDLQINKHFQQYRSSRPGVYAKDDSFGFGYAQPARAAVAYMLVNSDVIARVTRPKDKEVREYFRNNSTEFTKEVPITPPTTLPGATTQPDVPMRKVQMDIDEAWDQVVERLSGRAAESRTEEFIQQIQANIDAQLGPASADADLYKKVYARLIQSDSPAALERMISSKDIESLRGKTLDRAIPALAAAAGLKAICYPWDTTGEFSVSKDVRVPESLKADSGRTLAAVLEEITRLVFTAAQPAPTTKPAAGADAVPASQYPKLQWTSCRGFNNVLFPLGTAEGMTLLPVTVGRTMLLSGRELSENEDLGMARSSRRGRGVALPVAAIKSKPLVPGQIMYSFSGSGLRRILWQVIESRPAAVLDQPEGAVRKDVIADFRTIEGYKTLALRAAEQLAQKARTSSLEAAAKEAKLDATETAPVSRLTSQSQRDLVRRNIMQQAFMRGLPEGVDIQEYMAYIQQVADREAVAYRPNDYVPSRIEGLDFKTPLAAKRFLDRVFELVPVDVDKPVIPGEPGPVITVPMPTERAHFVVQRIGYTPAVAADFAESDRTRLTEEALANTEWDARKEFFGYASIAARLEYEDLYRSKEADQK